ncbi:transglycosylase SLT domain-containing protein [Phaeovulum sp.]|uniref:transglycosylase SLT domain-containing protein n=1 Tax=Phaeovulum sp. TaxID=2934796 RepID=UPI0039E45745
MHTLTRRATIMLMLSTVAACGTPSDADRRHRRGGGALHPGETPELRSLINTYADRYDVPRPLVHRIVQRESRYVAGARNGPYYGLMQILPQTARTMGFRGKPSDLLDAETNLKYGVKYLRGAWMCADGSYDRAVMWYSKGYYYEAKRRGILRETGLKG